jgi:hypothetical protein
MHTLIPPLSRPLLLGAVLSLGVTLHARADENVCTGQCAEYAQPGEPAVRYESLPEIRVEAPRAMPAPPCNASAIARIENLNDRIKPVREVIGYVHSPQSLAIKLVNDHVVHIPAWIGYAMDPVGAIKGRAIDMAKTRVKQTVLPAVGDNCVAGPIPAPGDEPPRPAPSEA